MKTLTNSPYLQGHVCKQPILDRLVQQDRFTCFYPASFNNFSRFKPPQIALARRMAIMERFDLCDSAISSMSTFANH